MADYSDFSGSIFDASEEKPEKKNPESGPDYSGLSFKDISQEEPTVETGAAPTIQPSFDGLSLQGDMRPELMTPGAEPRAGQYGVGGDPAFPDAISQYRPTQADFDTDEEDVVDFIRRKGFDIFQQGLVGQIGATEAEVGRKLQQKGPMEDITDAADEDADYFDKLKASIALMSPINTLTTIFTGNPLGAAETGAKMEERGAGVRTEARKDLEEAGKEADTTGKQIAFDVFSSAGVTAPALATAPLGSPLLTATAMGSTAYFDTTQEAYEKTEDLTKARIAGFIDGAIETGTEFIPIRSLMKLGKGKSMVKDALKFLAQEEGSEITAEALQMLNARLMYEPDLTMEQAMDTLARTALSTPFSAGLQAGAMRATQVVSDKAQAAVDKVRNRNKPPEFTAFDAETVKAAELSEEARKDVEALQTELQGIMQEIDQEAAVELTRDQRQAVYGTFDMDPGFARATPDFTSEQVFRTIRQNGIYPLRGRERIDPESMQPGEVLTAEMPDLYTAAVQNVREIEAALKRLKDTGSPYTGNMASLERMLEPAKARIPEARREQRELESKFGRAQDLVRNWVKRYAPDMKVVLTHANEPNTMGSTIPTSSNAPKIINLGLGVIRNMAKHHVQKEASGARPSIMNPGGALPETIAHEFGHALIGHLYAKQPESVQRALRSNWEQFLSNYAQGTVGEVAATLQPTAAQAMQVLPQGLNWREELNGPKLANNRRHWAKYIPSFEEFLAHRMARVKGGDTEMKKFFSQAKGQMEKFWKGLPMNMRYDKSFELFLDKLSKENELDRAKAQYEGRVRRYRAALAAMRDTATRPFTDVVGGGVNGVVPPTSGAHWGGRDGRSRRVNSSIDKFNKIVQLTAGLTHISDMNAHIPGVTNYLGHMKAMWQDKMKWTSRASEILKDWAGSEYIKGREERERFSKFMFEADRRSDQLDRKLSNDEMAELREEYGISNSMYEMAERVWGSFNEALNEVEDAVIAELQTQLTEGNPAEVYQTLQEVRRDFASLRNRNYMPHSRFGSYTLSGYAQEAMTLDDQEFKRGQQVYFGSYATERDTLAARKELEKEFGSGVRFGVGMVQDNVRELLDLPPALAQMLEKKLNLTADQQKELTDIRAMLAPGQSFRKRFMQREGVAGYSEDGLRVYADYMQKFAGHLSRIKHMPALESAIQLMKESARGIRQQGGNSIKREKIIKWYTDHLDYMLDPGNELASVRAIGFMWYLGFNPKSALVNATQVPMVTYPYLAQEYNDISASAAISSAMYQVTKAQFTKRGMDPDAARMVDELVERGIIDESLATELAALAEGGFMARAPVRISQWLRLDKPENTLKVQKFFEWGALLFQSMEKMNRRITAVAAYQLSRKAGDSHEIAVDKAHKAVEQTQYEYARINRPEMMRGPVKSNVFMFWQYITNTMWFLGQNRGAAARYMIIMFLLGGLEGIPFMGNALDFTDFAIKKLKEAAGWSDPKKGAREYLWELSSSLDDDPVLGNVVNSHTLMNGYASRMFGMYDISGSIQMGRILPGTNYLATDLNQKTEILGGMTDLAGATANIPLSIRQAVWSDEPDLWKRVERSLPSMAGAISAGIRYGVRGEEVDSRGAQLAEFSWPDDPTSWAEIMGRSAGFPLTRINEERERRFASYDAIQYYSKRHNGLMRMLNYAFDKDDGERMDEALDHIIKFNKQVPFPEMTIQTDSIVRSMKEAEKRRIMRESGIAEQKKYIRLQQDVEERRSGGSREEDM